VWMTVILPGVLYMDHNY